ncbi:MAG: SDR family oxidoreductase [Anaerolineae bacterium]|nr:SDR family oxidoreductase [Anaerolineae bacterium]
MTTILITGASKGIGRATALHLDRKGFTVLAGVRNAADGDDLCKEASARLQPILLDVTNPDQIAQVRELAGRQKVDGLVNNAGIAVAAPLEHLPIEEFRRQIEVNLTGQLAVTQALIPALRHSKGRIINISSIGGRIAGTMLGAYHASKFALEALTDTLRQELAPWDIQVVSIEPGGIATPIWDTSLAVANRLLAAMTEQGRQDYAQAIAGAQALAEHTTKSGLPPERVAEVIERALTARKPRTRYVVGMDAQIGTRILANLPDRLRDRVLGMRR